MLVSCPQEIQLCLQLKSLSPRYQRDTAYHLTRGELTFSPVEDCKVAKDVFILFYFSSSAFISWSSTHILFLDHLGTFCARGYPNVRFFAAHTGTQTQTAAIPTKSAIALTTSATAHTGLLKYFTEFHHM